MKKLSFFLCLAFAFAVPVSVQAQCSSTLTTSTICNSGGIDYELWNQNNVGTVRMNITGSGNNGSFNATWSGTQNVLFRSGKKWGANSSTTYSQLGNITLEFEATWQSGDNVKMLGVYGWAYYPQGQNPTRRENNQSASFSNQIEYYIIQDRGSYNPATSNDLCRSTPYGEATIDGVLYEFRVCDRIGQPMLTGNGNFKQFFSIPKNTSSHRTKGTIDVARHFKLWDSLGMNMKGPLYEIAMKVESYSGSNGNGNATVSKSILCTGSTCSGSTPPGNFTLVANASPAAGGTVTRSPNSSSYAPGTSVTVTATANTGWVFDGWSGDASGSGSAVPVTMNANKTVTAKFKLVADGTENLVKDGNFSGNSLSSNWSWNTGTNYGNSAGTSSVNSGKATLNITTPGAESYQPQLIQQGIPLDNGMKYRLTFTASAGAARDLHVGLQQSADPWGTYKDSTFSLTTAEKEYTIEFEMAEDSDPNTQLSFNVGGPGTAGTSVTISNVKLIYIAEFSEPTTKIADKIRPATYFSVKMQGNKALQIEVNSAATVEIYNLKGNKAASFDVLSGTQTVNLALPSGVYYAKVRGASAQYTKFVLK